MRDHRILRLRAPGYYGGNREVRRVLLESGESTITWNSL